VIFLNPLGVWILALDQKLQEELALEALTYKNSDVTSSMNEIFENLPRLRSFFCELVRIYGAAPLLFLETFESVQLLGEELEKGVQLIALTQYASRHSTNKHFDENSTSSGETTIVPLGPNSEQPSEFCPQRWLSASDGSGKVKFKKPSARSHGYFVSIKIILYITYI